jgi:hypothetical protein
MVVDTKCKGIWTGTTENQFPIGHLPRDKIVTIFRRGPMDSRSTLSRSCASLTRRVFGLLSSLLGLDSGILDMSAVSHETPMLRISLLWMSVRMKRHLVALPQHSTLSRSCASLTRRVFGLLSSLLGLDSGIRRAISRRAMIPSLICQPFHMKPQCSE